MAGFVTPMTLGLLGRMGPSSSKPITPALQPGNALATGLVRCIPFHEGSGSTLHDLASGNHDMTTRSGGSTTALAWSTAVDPYIGEFLTFDGIDDDAIGVDTGMVAGDNARTFAFLLRTSSTGSPKNFAGYGSAGSFDSVAFGVRSDNGVLCVRGPSSATGAGETTPVLNDGAWHLAVITYDNVPFKFYMDGIHTYDSSAVFAATTLSGNWFLGRGALTGSEAWLSCDIAGAWAWDHVLSAPDLASFQADPWQMVTGSAPSTFQVAWARNCNIIMSAGCGQ